MHEIHGSQPSMVPLEIWPPDDTEESIMGTDLHQLTIMNLRWGLNEIAGALKERHGVLPWHALGQTIITGFARPNGSRYKTLSDIFVYRQSIDRHRGSVALTVDGPPALIVEVLSESTYEADMDLRAGKGFSYAHAGVDEYLVVDPEFEIIGEGIRGWQRQSDAYVPWLPEGDGRRHSRSVEASFDIEDGLAAVYAGDGERQLREGEVSRERAELRELRRQLDELQRRR